MRGLRKFQEKGEGLGKFKEKGEGLGKFQERGKVKAMEILA